MLVKNENLKVGDVRGHRFLITSVCVNKFGVVIVAERSIHTGYDYGPRHLSAGGETDVDRSAN